MVMIMTVVMMMMSDDDGDDVSGDDDSDGEDKSVYAPHETCAEQLKGMVDK